MNTRELLTVVLEGGIPDTTPYSIYSYLVDDIKSDKWLKMFDMGLGLAMHTFTVKCIEHEVKYTVEEKKDGKDIYTIHRKETPVGTIQQAYKNGWHTEYWIKKPGDYKVMQWIVENTEIIPCYENYDKAKELAGDYGVIILTEDPIIRTPAMRINIDWAGTETFCIDIAMEVPELFDLYKATGNLFKEGCKMVAAGPGKYVKWFENLTISMLGPERYRELLVPVYNECVPILEAGGKRVMVHYDGALRIIKEDISAAPFHMIESLTEPAEGDMTYDECRTVWPDKVFWANINLENYYKPLEELKQVVKEKRQRAGKKGFAFEISEDLPDNWQQTIPVVLEALKELE